MNRLPRLPAICREPPGYASDSDHAVHELSLPQDGEELGTMRVRARGYFTLAGFGNAKSHTER